MHSDPPALATKNSIVIIPDIRYNDSFRRRPTQQEQW
jgi:hypothetical protein